MGYVLSQIDGTEEAHPIALVSEKLLVSERNYSAIEHEALAMFKELNTFVPICRDQSLQSKQTKTINSAWQPEGQSWQVGMVGPIITEI